MLDFSNPTLVMWLLQGAIALVPAALTAGILYGVMKTKIKHLEEAHQKVQDGLEGRLSRAKTEADSELAELLAAHQAVATEVRQWMLDRKHSVRTVDICDLVQARCQQRFCGKVDKLLERFDHHCETQEKKWNNLTGLLGGLCAKLEIELPNLS